LKTLLLYKKLPKDSNTGTENVRVKISVSDYINLQLKLGMVIRTIFLLKYIIDMDVRQKITNETNKVESYNGFIDKIRFGDDWIISWLYLLSKDLSSLYQYFQ